jgi:hypothetical protein
MALDRREALDDLMAPIARDQQDLQPLTGSGRVGERGLVGGLAPSFRTRPAPARRNRASRQ